MTTWTTERIEPSAEFGAKVFREPWKGHIAQKNAAAEKATQPWLLGLDADEEISSALRDEIRRAIAEPGDCAASFPRCTQFADAGSVTATGIPTGRRAYGDAARRNGEG